MGGRLIIFWDYDTQWGADRSRSPGGPKSWGALEFENTERLLDLHAEYNIPACFAVVGAAALPGERPYHDPDQVRRIAQAGHEVASHSMYHDWLPGLGDTQLLQTLRESKEALEQCIGDSVVSFVPPFNQPFDYSSRLSISLSERREAGVNRIDLPRLCKALSETGFLFSRVSYSSLFERVISKVLGKDYDRPGKLEKIRELTCVRLNTPAGFKEQTLQILERCMWSGGLVIAWGHPHSLRSGNPQDEKYFIPFLEQVQHFRSDGKLQVVLPKQLAILDGKK